MELVRQHFWPRVQRFFLPRVKAGVRVGTLLRAAAFVTIPAVMVLAIGMLYGFIGWEFALFALMAIFLISLLLVLPYVANLAALTGYVKTLAADKNAEAPDLSFLNNVEELSGAVAKLHESWDKRRKLLEAMVSESKILIDSLPDALIMLDDRGTIVRTNSTAKLLFGGLHFKEKMQLIIDDPKVKELIAEVDASKRGKTIEYTLPELNKEYLMRVEKFPTYSPGGISVIMAMHEVTELKRTEQMFADFVANASHEIRTPLTSIKGFIETLATTAKGDPKALDMFLPIMTEQAERMNSLVKDLLSLSEIERNVSTAPTDEVNIRKILEESCGHNQWGAQERGMHLDLFVADDIPFLIGDKNELVRVFDNLISNAVKYGKKESTVVITARKVLTGLPREILLANRGSAVAVSVADQGEGIPADELPRLAERFYRAKAARSKKISGTGLGLAIVKRILDRHHGTMIIESDVGKGSTFTVYLPI